MTGMSAKFSIADKRDAGQATVERRISRLEIPPEIRHRRSKKKRVNVASLANPAREPRHAILAASVGIPRSLRRRRFGRRFQVGVKPVDRQLLGLLVGFAVDAVMADVGNRHQLLGTLGAVEGFNPVVLVVEVFFFLRQDEQNRAVGRLVDVIDRARS